MKCGKTLGKGSEAWIFALDAMVKLKKTNKLMIISKLNLTRQGKAFAPVQKVKQDETRLTDFKGWNSKLEKAFKGYVIVNITKI